MPISPNQTYYSSFNYRSAFGTNPYSRRARDLDSWINRSRSSASSRDSETHIARPGDVEVVDYMANVLGGQRKTLDDYVRKTAGAGIKRGGMNVAGGPARDSMLHQNAMKTLASGYSDRFRDAMNYNKYVKATRYGAMRDSSQDLQNLLGVQQRYVQGEADWQSRVGEAKRADWRGDVDWNRSEPLRKTQLDFTRRQNQVSLDALRRQSEMDQWRNLVEKEERDRLVQDRGLWNQLRTKAALASRAGATAAGWTTQDDALADYLSVRLGITQPWRRSLSRSMSIK